MKTLFKNAKFNQIEEQQESKLTVTFNSKKNLLKVIDGRKQIPVCGVVVKVDDQAQKGGKTSFTSPDYSESTNDKIFAAYGQKSGARFLIVGKVRNERCQLSNLRSQAQPKLNRDKAGQISKGELSDLHHDLESLKNLPSLVEDSSDDEKMEKTVRLLSSLAVDASRTKKHERYRDELERIAIETEAKKDSHVRLWFLMTYLGASRSNLYKKMKIGDFPKPIKRGGRDSFWLLSEIELYRSGEWMRQIG